MRADYTITPRARGDLDEIWRHTERDWDADQAETYLRRLATAFGEIASGHRPGRNADDIRLGYWTLAVGSHTVFYRRQDDGRVQIVRVLHGRMDPRRHL